MNKAAYKDMWVHVEHDGKTVSPVSFELCCEARRLCDSSGDALAAVVAGELAEPELEKLRGCGIDKLILVSGKGYDRYSTEAYSNLYVELCKKYRPSAVFVGATVNGRDFAPHFAARLETGCTSDATVLVYNEETGDIEFIEPAAGGRIMAVIGEEHPIVTCVRGCLESCTGRRPEIQGLASGADARLLTNFADTPTVLCGPGSIDNAHSINEYVPVDEYLAAVHMFCKLFTEWCGTAE